MHSETSIEKRKGYWRTVRARAWQSAWKEGGMKAKTLTVLVLLMVTAIVGVGAYFKLFSLPFFQSQTASVEGGAYAFVISFIVAVILFFVATIRIPPQMHSEKLAEIEIHQQRILDLEESIRPKFELSYDVNDRNIYQDFGPGDAYVYRLKVKNTGGKQIQDIKVEIVEMIPATYRNLPVKLHAMNDPDDPIGEIVHSLNPQRSFLVDAIEIHSPRLNLSGAMFFYAERKDKRFPCSIADHKILVSVSGRDAVPVEKWFEFSVDPPESEQPYAITELE